MSICKKFILNHENDNTTLGIAPTLHVIMRPFSVQVKDDRMGGLLGDTK